MRICRGTSMRRYFEDAGAKALGVPGDRELVRVRDYISDLAVDLRYATANNFTGKVIYDFNGAWLRYGTVKKLALVQEKLQERGFGLLLWDAYRPAAAQFKLWETTPDPTFVANPHKGHSAHSSGGTVDVGLVRLSDGLPAEMPSGFDEFSDAANRDYSDAAPMARENALLLENTMKEAGFSAYFSEWWHYTDMDKYPYEDVEGIALPGSETAMYVPANGALVLFGGPEKGAEPVGEVPAEEKFHILGFAEDFVRIACNGAQGYAAADEVRPAE